MMEKDRATDGTYGQFATKKDFNNSQGMRNVVGRENDETDTNFLARFELKPHVRILNLYRLLGKDTTTNMESNSLAETQSDTSSTTEPYFSDWSSGGTLSNLENISMFSIQGFDERNDASILLDELSFDDNINSKETTDCTNSASGDSYFSRSNFENGDENEDILDYSRSGKDPNRVASKDIDKSEDIQYCSKLGDDPHRVTSENISDEASRKSEENTDSELVQLKNKTDEASKKSVENTDSERVQLKKKAFDNAASRVISVVEAHMKYYGSTEDAEISVKTVLLTELSEIYTDRESVQESCEKMSSEICEIATRLVSAKLSNESLMNILAKKISSFNIMNSS